MSQTNTIQNLSVMGLVDKRINASANSQQIYIAQKGASVVTSNYQNTTSFSTTNWNWTIVPPNNNIFIDRLMWVRLPGFTITFDQDVRTSLGVNMGLRQFPLNSIFQTATCNINNNQISVVTAEILHAMMRYSTCYNRQDRIQSVSASMPDEYQDYNGWQNPQYGGSNRNPLSAYGECIFQNRGAILPDSISLDGKTLTYTLTEPLFMLSPWLYEEEEHLGLIGVSTLQYNFNLVSNLGARMWCNDGSGAPITSAVVAFPNAPQLIFTYLTPPMTMYIPPALSYPYYNITRYTSPPVTLGAFGSLITPDTTTTTSNNVQLTEIPKCMYIFMKRQFSDLVSTVGYNYTDTFAVINNISVTFNNLSSMFSTFLPQALYDLSRKNGLQMSWVQWNKFCGSVLKFEPAVDFGLPSTLSAGSLGAFNFQYTVNFTNTSSNAVTYTPYLVVVNEGVMTIGDNSTVLQTGVLSKMAVLNSVDLPQVEYDKVQRLEGGAIFGRLKSFLQGAKPILNKIARVGEVVGEVGSLVGGPYAPGFSVGKKISSLVRQSTGGKAKMYKRRGKGLYGAGIETNNDEESIDV